MNVMNYEWIAVLVLADQSCQASQIQNVMTNRYAGIYNFLDGRIAPQIILSDVHQHDQESLKQYHIKHQLWQHFHFFFIIKTK